MYSVTQLLIIIPALPLLSALVIAVLGPRLLRQHSHWPALIAIAGSFLASAALLLDVGSFSPDTTTGIAIPPVPLFTWVDIPATQVSAPFGIEVTLRADPLTAVMLVMVTFIASLVVLFSIGYMHGDRGYWRFFAYVSLFVFSMTMLVTVSNFLLLFVFWEAVGVCSYLLIGFWYEKPSAAAAGMKAFLVNRVGDFGLALALLLMWLHYGTLNFHDTPEIPGILGQLRLTHAVGFVGGGVGLAICLLLLLAACGKSAQFPLHIWLPDAMEGPTPVSALIHAATMVTAGVYMITRSAPLFAAVPEAQLCVSLVGGVTAFMAALIALTQCDLKRVLAYSTISQLGYMFLALGTGSVLGLVAGMFHLFTHAFFKALLFLGSGSVMHAMGNVIDMRRFSGLRHIMPVTHATFAVGCLALSGVFPFAGFWSKDAILAAVHERAAEVAYADSHHDHAAQLAAPGLAVIDGSEVATHSVTHLAAVAAHSESSALPYAQVYHWLYYCAVFTAFLTAFYTFRAFFMTFYGKQMVPDEAGHHAHESPPTMTVPLLILAVCSLGVGFLGWNLETGLPGFLAGTPSLAFIAESATHAAGHASDHTIIAVTSMVAAVSGIGLAAFLYLGGSQEIDIISSFLQMRWLEQTADMKWLHGLAYRVHGPRIVELADRVGLGWVPRVLGYAVVLLLGVILSPLLLGYYISPYKLSEQKFFLDELYQWLIVRPLMKLADFAYAVDRLLVDGLVNLVGRLPAWLGLGLRRWQTGILPGYGLGMALGTLVIFVLSLVFVRS